MSDVSYLTTYKEVIVSPQSNFWINAMKDEMTSMSQNKMWSLVDLPNDYIYLLGGKGYSRPSAMPRDR